jgi:hypothetical protein
VRVLLDESLPRPLPKLLAGHDVKTVSQFRSQVAGAVADLL